MNVNFKRLVDLHHIPSTEPLLPLYEAIVNSIQSTEDAGIGKKRIDIKIHREKQMTLGPQWETDISSIEIVDNGIGFNDDNYNSFNVYASDYKYQKGCKGVGRLLWLKAFSEVDVKSLFKSDGKTYLRTFQFNITNEVDNMNLKEVDCSQPLKTKIVLKDMLSHHKQNTPKMITTIAKNILKHCFIYFVLGDIPDIYISDNREIISINYLFEEFRKEYIEEEKFEVKNETFKIIHTKNFTSTSSKNTVDFCANNRSVKSINISNTLNIQGKLGNQENSYVYEGFLLSDFLDRTVNRERTAFNIQDETGNLYEELTQKDILEKVNESILNFLEGDLKKYNEDKLDYITNYVYNENPKYRYLINSFPECVDNIPWVDDKEKLELELFIQEQTYKLKLKTDGIKLEKEIKNEKDFKKSTSKKIQHISKLSEMGKSNLIEYVLHRKIVLELLEENLNYTDENTKNYAYEKQIHELVFPMQKTSDDIDYQKHNLWIIDEKLSYHYYLASDKSLQSMSIGDFDSDKEPDIIIFDKPFAFADENKQPFNDITIIEFKRPGRDYYGEGDNPIQQVKGYINDILNNKIKTKDGRPLDGRMNMRFFCYIICDIDNKLEAFANSDDMQDAPDGMGYYKYHKRYNAYIEILPYNKLIQNSKLRNQILFDKLFDR